MPFIFPNYEHQQYEWDNHREDTARFLQWYMRTGKTKAMIDLACHLSKENKIVTTLIIAPNGVHYNWMYKEIPAHAWDFVEQTDTFLHFSARDPDPDIDAKLKASGHLWITINVEALILPRVLKLIQDAIKRGPALLVVDESHMFKRPGSKRTRRLRALSKYFTYKRLLSGTPIDNSPLGAYTQFEILSPGALGFARFDEFKDRYVNYRYERRGGRLIPVVDKYKNLDELGQKMGRWMTKVGKEGLPPFIETTRHFELTTKQRKLYEDLKKDLMASLDSGELITAVQGGAKIIRLQQILSGFAVDEFGKYHQVDKTNPRLDTLIDELDDRPTIIWCRFKEDIRLVAERLRAEGITFGEYHGAVNPKDRPKVIDDFMSGKTQVFLGQPAAGGTGLNLSAAHTIIWYNLTFDLTEYNQASERATIKGGHSVALVHICATKSVDEYISTMLKNKKSIVKDVLDGGTIKEYL